MDNDLKSSKEARAYRLVSLRKMTRLSKAAFAKKHGISTGNFQNWEGPRYGGLTEQGAKRIIKGLKEEGILCSLEWLMHGAGEGPKITEKLYLKDFNTKEFESNNSIITKSQEIEKITKELQIFRNHNEDILSLLVNDNSMEPKHEIGEYVAGKKYYNLNMINIIDKNCLVQTIDNDILLRRIKKGSKDGIYTLACTNINTNIENPVIYDAKIIAAAPIMWVRRPLDFFDILS